MQDSAVGGVATSGDDDDDEEGEEDRQISKEEWAVSVQSAELQVQKGLLAALRRGTHVRILTDDDAGRKVQWGWRPRLATTAIKMISQVLNFFAQ